MPTRASYTRQPLPAPVMHQVDRRSASGYLPRTYWPEDAHGDRIARAGSIVAEIEGGLPEWDMTGTTPYFVPYSPTAAYGLGSDTADGILDETYDVTINDWQVTIVTAGIAIEKYCQVPGGQIGDIPDAVKTDLSNIEWR